MAPKGKQTPVSAEPKDWLSRVKGAVQIYTGDQEGDLFRVRMQVSLAKCLDDWEKAESLALELAYHLRDGISRQEVENLRTQAYKALEKTAKTQNRSASKAKAEKPAEKTTKKTTEKTAKKATEKDTEKGAEKVQPAPKAPGTSASSSAAPATEPMKEPDSEPEAEEIAPVSEAELLRALKAAPLEKLETSKVPQAEPRERDRSKAALDTKAEPKDRSKAALDTKAEPKDRSKDLSILQEMADQAPEELKKQIIMGKTGAYFRYMTADLGKVEFEVSANTHGTLQNARLVAIISLIAFEKTRRKEFDGKAPPKAVLDLAKLRAETLLRSKSASAQGRPAEPAEPARGTAKGRGKSLGKLLGKGGGNGRGKGRGRGKGAKREQEKPPPKSWPPPVKKEENAAPPRSRPDKEKCPFCGQSHRYLEKHKKNKCKGKKTCAECQKEYRSKSEERHKKECKGKKEKKRDQERKEEETPRKKKKQEEIKDEDKEREAKRQKTEAPAMPSLKPLPPPPLPPPTTPPPAALPPPPPPPPPPAVVPPEPSWQSVDRKGAKTPWHHASQKDWKEQEKDEPAVAPTKPAGSETPWHHASQKDWKEQEKDEPAVAPTKPAGSETHPWHHASQKDWKEQEKDEPAVAPTKPAGSETHPWNHASPKDWKEQEKDEPAVAPTKPAGSETPWHHASPKDWKEQEKEADREDENAAAPAKSVGSETHPWHHASPKDWKEQEKDEPAVAPTKPAGSETHPWHHASPKDWKEQEKEADREDENAAAPAKSVGSSRVYSAAGRATGFFDRKASEPQPELSQPSQPSQPSQQPGAKVVLGHKWTNRSRTPLPRRRRHPAEPPAPSAEPSAELAPEEPREKGSEQAEGCQLFQLMMPKAKIKAKAMPRRPTPTSGPKPRTKEDHEAELAADTPPAESQSPTSPVSSPSSPPRKALLRPPESPETADDRNSKRDPFSCELIRGKGFVNACLNAAFRRSYAVMLSDQPTYWDEALETFLYQDQGRWAAVSLREGDVLMQLMSGTSATAMATQTVDGSWQDSSGQILGGFEPMEGQPDLPDGLLQRMPEVGTSMIFKKGSRVRMEDGTKGKVKSINHSGVTVEIQIEGADGLVDRLVPSAALKPGMALPGQKQGASVAPQEVASDMKKLGLDATANFASCRSAWRKSVLQLMAQEMCEEELKKVAGQVHKAFTNILKYFAPNRLVSGC